MPEPDGPRKTVIVTGASRGVGLAIAERLAAADYRIVAIARAEGELAAARQRLAGSGEIVFRQSDVFSAQSRLFAAEAAYDRYLARLSRGG